MFRQCPTLLQITLLETTIDNIKDRVKLPKVKTNRVMQIKIVGMYNILMKKGITKRG